MEKIKVYINQIYIDHDTGDHTVSLIVDREDINHFKIGKTEIVIEKG